MGIFSKKAPSEPSSLAVAYSALLAEFATDLRPEKIEPLLGGPEWTDIAAITDKIDVKEVGYQGTWPTGPHSIVKFQYQDQNQPYIEVGGNQTANIIDHYCLIADFLEHTVLDSADAVVKDPRVYGSPVGWARFDTVDPDKPAPESDSEPVKPAPDTENTYTMKPNENFWEVARRLKLSAEELKEHNGIENPQQLPVGTVLHLPYRQQAEKKDDIRYELFDTPKQMHVSRKGGTKKWSFGNAKKWSDMSGTGHYIHGAPVLVSAIAHVTLGDEEAAYYMDARAVGDFATTGRVAMTTGYAWQDLSEGLAPEPTPPPKKVAEEKLEEQKKREDVDVWQATYRPFDEPERYVVTRALTVFEHADTRAAKVVEQYQEVTIAGTFTKDDVVYGRPTGAVQSGLWYGLPMHVLTEEREVYNTNVDLATRVQSHVGSLTPKERGVVALSRTLAQYTKLMSAINKKIKEKS